MILFVCDCEGAQSNTVHLIFSTVSPLSLMNNVSLMASFSTLFPGLIAGDSISPEKDEVSGTEGQSVNLKCQYETTETYVALHWYRHHSDLQAPQFILWKGAKSNRDYEYIPDTRYQFSSTLDSTSNSVPLKIQKLQLSDSAVYYCALQPTVTGNTKTLYKKPLEQRQHNTPQHPLEGTCCFTSFYSSVTLQVSFGTQQEFKCC
uniref:Ig-like domain-containing protein n=1 Tax=Sparus aurata TaxID=8175 RepID=A0A671TYX0_SPAAU